MSGEEIAGLIGELTLTRDEAERETKLLKAKIGTYAEAFEKMSYAVSGVSGKKIMGNQTWPTPSDALSILESAPPVSEVLYLVNRLQEETVKMETADAELAKVRGSVT